jgi:hypothetical protein
MHESATVHFPRFYAEPESSSAVRYIAHVDPMLLEDGTCFVLQAGEELVACGGWSRRGKLYTGSGDADDARLTILRPSLLACVRCSCATTGHVAGSVDASSKRARRRHGARGSASWP